MDKENMALLDLLGFCIPLTWILWVMKAFLDI